MKGVEGQVVLAWCKEFRYKNDGGQRWTKSSGTIWTAQAARSVKFRDVFHPSKRIPCEGLLFAEDV